MAKTKRNDYIIIVGKRKSRVRIPSVTKGPLRHERMMLTSFLVQRPVVDPAGERRFPEYSD
jgi:hypothetical protein